MLCHRHYWIDADVILLDIEELPFRRIVGHCEAFRPAQEEIGKEIEVSIEREVPQGTARRTLGERK